MVVSRHVACFVVGVLPIHGKKTCLGAQLNSARCEKCKTFTQHKTSELKMKTMERIFEIKDLKALEDFLQSQTETRSFFVRLLTTIS